ncbi:hypothetical protein DRN51_06590, partial [Thermococci archaeon]
MDNRDYLADIFADQDSSKASSPTVSIKNRMGREGFALDVTQEVTRMKKAVGERKRFYAHGTNGAALGGILQSGVLPGEKLKERGLVPLSGESGATTELNRRFVSAINLSSYRTDNEQGQKEGHIENAIRYAYAAVARGVTPETIDKEISKLKKTVHIFGNADYEKGSLCEMYHKAFEERLEDLYQLKETFTQLAKTEQGKLRLAEITHFSKIPIVIVGEGVGKTTLVHSSIEGEEGIEKIKPTIVATEEKYLDDVYKIIKRVEVTDIKMATMSEIKQLQKEFLNDEASSNASSPAVNDGLSVKVSNYIKPILIFTGIVALPFIFAFLPKDSIAIFWQKLKEKIWSVAHNNIFNPEYRMLKKVSSRLMKAANSFPGWKEVLRNKKLEVKFEIVPVCPGIAYARLNRAFFLLKGSEDIICGTVGVSKGLIKLLSGTTEQRESKLAWLTGHELSHLANRDGQESWRGIYSEQSEVTLSKLSIKKELRADTEGVNLAAYAGYSPFDGFFEIWDDFERFEKNNAAKIKKTLSNMELPDYQTHPSDQERIEYQSSRSLPMPQIRKIDGRKLRKVLRKIQREKQVSSSSIEKPASSILHPVFSNQATQLSAISYQLSAKIASSPATAMCEVSLRTEKVSSLAASPIMGQPLNTSVSAVFRGYINKVKKFIFTVIATGLLLVTIVTITSLLVPQRAKATIVVISKHKIVRLPNGKVIVDGFSSRDNFKTIAAIMEILRVTDPYKTDEDLECLVKLLLSVAAHESGYFRYDVQLKGGPARSYFQLEPWSALDVMIYYYERLRGYFDILGIEFDEMQVLGIIAKEYNEKIYPASL